MTVTIADPAEVARRAGVVAAVRAMPRITLGELCQAMKQDGHYADTLRTITVEELRGSERAAPPRTTRNHHPEDAKDTMLRTFRSNPTHKFASGFFVKLLGLPRWTVASLLGELVAADVLERSGRTGSTRYRLLVADESSDESRRRAKLGGET